MDNVHDQAIGDQEISTVPVAELQDNLANQTFIDATALRIRLQGLLEDPPTNHEAKIDAYRQAVAADLTGIDNLSAGMRSIIGRKHPTFEKLVDDITQLRVQIAHAMIQPDSGESADATL